MKKNISNISKKFVKGLAYATLVFPSSGTLGDVINWCISVMSYLVPLLIGAAVIFFLYGILRFIVKSSAGDAEGRKEAINFMVFGIIGIAVMVSVWGLVAFVTNTFGVSNFVPQFPTIGGSGGTNGPCPNGPAGSC